MPETPTTNRVDELAAIIRRVDGSNTIGAGALDEAILDEFEDTAGCDCHQPCVCCGNRTEWTDVCFCDACCRHDTSPLPLTCPLAGMVS